MGVEEICNTGLTLCLGSLESTTTPKNQLDQLDHHQHNKKYSSSQLSDRLFPSLSLALSSEVLTNQGAPIIDISGKVVEGETANNLKRQVSSLSVVSSFSNSTSVKREREIINVVSGEEDVEVEKVVVYSSKHDEDQDDQEYFGVRKKLRLSKDQSLVLEESFKEHSTLNPKQKQALAKRLNLLPRQVEVWFQNRRARTKLKQTEVECEMLKKCCETLTEENRRLKKEVQDLKAFKSTTPTAAPFYMQLSAATITLCPSCQRISGTNTNTNTNTTSTVTESSSKSPFSSKPQFYATTLAHASAPSYSSTLQTS